MRFEIKDLLLFTLLAALAAVGWLGYERKYNLRERIVQTEADLQNFETTKQNLENGLVDSTARLDFYAEVAKVHQVALEGFPEVQQRYGIVEPRLGKVSIRSVPTVSSARHQSPTHYRISIPEQTPVFLRSAVASAPNDLDRNKRELDAQEWLETSPLSVSAKSQIQIPPGIHDLHITISRHRNEASHAAITLELDGQVLAICEVASPKNVINSWSTVNSRVQSDIDLRGRTYFLADIEIDHKEDKQAVFEFWAWLSRDQSVKFDDYPRSKREDSDE